jgi:hypothetical protein
MNEQELIEKIAFNVIQGRVTSEDEGYDEGPGRPVGDHRTGTDGDQ